MKRFAVVLLLVACHAEERIAEKPIALPSVAMASPTLARVELARTDDFGAPRTWLALGEQAFARGDMEKAARCFEEILHTDNELVGYAWYKLAFIRWNLGDGPRALDAMTHTVRWTDTQTDASAQRLGKAARRDLVPIYAQYGTATYAYAFFHHLLVTDDETRRALDALARAYVDQGKADGALTIRQEIAARYP